MLRVVVAVSKDRARALADGLAAEGIAIVDVTSPERAAEAVSSHGDSVHALVLDAGRATLTRRVVAACDQRGIRILPICRDEAGRRLAAGFGLLDPLPPDADAWRVAESLAAPTVAREGPFSQAPDGEVVVVWGAHGAPGRTTLAIELAAELARGPGRVGLVDADAHAPSLALALGLLDEGPGFAAACRQAERGELDDAELTRVSTPVDAGTTSMDVLTGLNRPGRWPELSESRVSAALTACRTWCAYTVVDVAASLERDEEMMSDLDGLRRNAATIAALQSADTIVAVCAADPVGVSRFLRAYPELRATVGPRRIVTVVNRLRSAAIGVDGRGQIRRTLERFAGIEETWFVPLDPRSTDAALLAGRPVAAIAPRSPLASAVRRIVGGAVAPVGRRVGGRAARA